MVRAGGAVHIWGGGFLSVIRGAKTGGDFEESPFFHKKLGCDGEGIHHFTFGGTQRALCYLWEKVPIGSWKPGPLMKHLSVMVKNTSALYKLLSLSSLK